MSPAVMAVLLIGSLNISPHCLDELRGCLEAGWKDRIVMSDRAAQETMKCAAKFQDEFCIYLDAPKRKNGNP